MKRFQQFSAFTVQSFSRALTAVCIFAVSLSSISYAAHASQIQSTKYIYILNLLASGKSDYQAWTHAEIQSELKKTSDTFAQCGVRLTFKIVDIDLGDFEVHPDVKSGNFINGTGAFDIQQFTASSDRRGPIVVLADKLIIESPPGKTPDIYSWSEAAGMAYSREVVTQVPFYQYLEDVAFVFRRSISENNSQTYSTIAHELGHILMNAGHFGETEQYAVPNLMSSGSISRITGYSTVLTKAQCAAVLSYRYN